MFDYDKRGERATRDIVCRGVADRIRKGHASPNGGVYISMGHLGADNVRREFKGMVERCADCGFDLAGGQVEVVPTAHYMMGGVQFDADCTHRDAAASSRPARTPAACTAPTGSAATASPTRRCSAASPATAWRRRCAPMPSSPIPTRRRSRRRTSAPMRRSAGAAAISKACGGGSIR